MRAVLGPLIAEKRRNFKLVLWLHDGAYCSISRSAGARETELNELLEERREELRKWTHDSDYFSGKSTPIPAHFEIEEIGAES